MQNDAFNLTPAVGLILVIKRSKTPLDSGGNEIRFFFDQKTDVFAMGMTLFNLFLANFGEENKFNKNVDS